MAIDQHHHHHHRHHHCLYDHDHYQNGQNSVNIIFIGLESDHWHCLSATDSLTHWLPFSKLDWCDPGMWRWQLKTCCYCLAMLVTHWLTDWLTHWLLFSRLDDEDRVGNSLLQIWELRYGVSQRTLCKKKKCSPHHVTGGYLERSYPEGEADQTSLGGRHWHLKFDEIGGSGGIGSGFLQ